MWFLSKHYRILFVFLGSVILVIDFFKDTDLLAIGCGDPDSSARIAFSQKFKNMVVVFDLFHFSLD